MPNLSLERAASRLVRRLGGVWHSYGGLCRCPAHDDQTPSLSVRVGDRSLLFKCFAGCAGLDVIQALRRLKLDIPVDDARQVVPATGLEAVMAARAKEIWNESWPLIGTIGEAYLRSRSIYRFSTSLRVNPRTPLGRGRNARFMPAIIAAVQDDSGIISVQRLFLDRDGCSLASDLPKAKLTLGRPLAGAVRLSQPTDCLGLAEGIETAESAATLLGLPVWATLGNERMARITIPDSIDRLILLPDNDAGGRLANRAAHLAFARPGRTILTQWPWRGLNDWNDVLCDLGL